jgi:thioredoxin 1
MAILEINEVDLDDALVSDKHVVIYIWAPWCGPCKMMGPIMGLVAEDFARDFDFAKLNADEATATLEKYSVSSVPTLLVFKDGKLVYSITGAKPKALLVEQLKTLL